MTSRRDHRMALEQGHRLELEEHRLALWVPRGCSPSNALRDPRIRHATWAECVDQVSQVRSIIGNNCSPWLWMCGPSVRDIPLCYGQGFPSCIPTQMYGGQERLCIGNDYLQRSSHQLLAWGWADLRARQGRRMDSWRLRLPGRRMTPKEISQCPYRGWAEFSSGKSLNQAWPGHSKPHCRVVHSHWSMNVEARLSLV